MYNKDKILKVVDEIISEAHSVSPFVVVAQPRRNVEETPIQEFNSRFGKSINFDGFSQAYISINGEKVDVARNYLIEMAIEIGAKYLFFIGEDTALPNNAFFELLKVAEENPDSVVTGVYYYKLGGPMIVVKEENYLKIPNCDPGQVFEAWLTGMDCMLVPVKILKEMKESDPELPFCVVYNSGDDFLGEDNFFTYRLRKHGYRLLVNTNVQCLHVDLASGKYTAHPNVNLSSYNTLLPITNVLTEDDKAYLESRWISRLPKGSFGEDND